MQVKKPLAIRAFSFPQHSISFISALWPRVLMVLGIRWRLLTAPENLPTEPDKKEWVVS
jgi:hypothetical protein